MNTEHWIALSVALSLCSGCKHQAESNAPAVPRVAAATTTIAPRVSDRLLYDELFDDSVLHQFILEISQEQWDGVTQDMLDYEKAHPIHPLLYDGDGRPYRTNNYREANFIYRRADGTEIKLNRVGLRSRGNESRRLPSRDGKYYKSHFKVQFGETFHMPKGEPATEALGRRRFAGMKALNFKWSRDNDWDQYANRSKINELFSYRLLAKIGISAPRMSMGTLKFRIAGKEINYGLYGIVEPVDEEFLHRRYGAAQGDLYKCLYLGPGPYLTEESLAEDRVGVKDSNKNYRPLYDLKTNKKKSKHSALREFVHQVNALGGKEFVEFIETKFEVDRFIRYLAMGIYINNLDDYRFLANNYYLYFDGEGKTDFIPYDFDISLGTAWHGELPYDEFIGQDIFKTKNIPTLWGDNSPRPLVDKILSIEEYRERYVKYLADYINPENRLFLYSEYKAKFEQLYALYGNKTANDTVDPDTMSLMGYEKKYFYDKTKNVLDQLNIGHPGHEIE